MGGCILGYQFVESGVSKAEIKHKLQRKEKKIKHFQQAEAPGPSKKLRTIVTQDT